MSEKLGTVETYDSSENNQDIKKSIGRTALDFFYSNSDELPEYIGRREPDLAFRMDAARAVIDRINKQDAFKEAWSNKESRLEYISADNFPGFYQVVNSALRGIDFKKSVDLTAHLPSLGTPRGVDKYSALIRGHEAIQEYIADSEEDIDTKLFKVASASEALIVWTHLFGDGNGRTSRFVASLIESEPGESMDGVIKQAASKWARPKKIYNPFHETVGFLDHDLNSGEVVIYNDEHRNELLERKKNAPDDIEGMYMNIKTLLEGDNWKKFNRKI